MNLELLEQRTHRAIKAAALILCAVVWVAFVFLVLALTGCTYAPDSDRAVSYNTQVLAFWTTIVTMVVGVVGAWLGSRINKMSKKLDEQQEELLGASDATKKAVEKVGRKVDDQTKGDADASK